MEIKVNAIFSWILYPDFKSITSETEFTIGSFKVKEVLSGTADLKGRNLVAKGRFLPKKEEQVGVLYTLEGQYTQDNKGRWALDVSTCVPAVPETKQEMVAFLSCGILKGVGPKIAEKMYKQFGDQILSILEKEPMKLVVVPGISEAKAKLIGTSYKDRGTAVQDFAEQLRAWSISPEVAVKAYEVLGPRCATLVKESLYHLVDRHILDFSQVEAYAMKKDFNLYDRVRLEKGIMTLLRGNENGRSFDRSGNLYCELNLLVQTAISLLRLNESDEGTILSVLSDMDNRKLVHWDKYHDVVYRFKTFEAEKTAAERVARQLRKASFTKENLADDLEKECLDRGINLGDEQKAAVLMALQQPFSVITGFPGTGKTTIQQVTLALLDKVYGEKAVLLAPTGRASKRMQESTGHSASTIHSALGLTEDAEPTGADDEPRIVTDMLIVDEASMMDMFVFSALMRFVEAKRICIIGDIDQLPSVGAGCVLKDLIETPLVNLTRLTRIYRQEAVSGIVANAMYIREGKHKLFKDKTFHFIEMDDSSIMEAAIAEYEKQVKIYGQENVVLLSPYRKTNTLSTTLLNQELQQRMNPDRGQTKFNRRQDGSMVFRVGDPILLTKNMPEKGVMNGDVGIFVNSVNEQMIVDFGGTMAAFDKADVQYLDLSYATTVHKSQGSEYKCVIMIVSLAHKYLANRGILYTGMTRAKTEFFAFGQIQAYSYAISTVDQYERKSLLKERIRRAFHEEERLAEKKSAKA